MDCISRIRYIVKRNISKSIKIKLCSKSWPEFNRLKGFKEERIMKFLLCVTLLCCVGFTLGQLCPQDAAVDTKLRDGRFIKKQVDCILSKGKCNGLGKKLKRKVPEVLRGLCPKPCKPCDQKQIKKIVQVMQEKYPREWNEIITTYNG
nr:uncharacterized protein LOC121128928 [Lepeophtheirus salmonis]